MQDTAHPAPIPIELKYCEACGGLWFRLAGCGEVYCARCARTMGEIALARGGRYAD